MYDVAVGIGAGGAAGSARAVDCGGFFAVGELLGEGFRGWCSAPDGEVYGDHGFVGPGVYFWGVERWFTL